MSRFLYDQIKYMAALNSIYDEPTKTFDRRLVLRQYYMDAIPEIIELAKRSPIAWADIYPFD